ncbi:MAG: hypothetical protein BWY88_00792 [Synergistetes bacterium ADurb.Bin520]|nr:MAG: hypothetical protein BWY88_00792 [Synergistetes bacterium ADurb.Bin520]
MLAPPQPNAPPREHLANTAPPNPTPPGAPCRELLAGSAHFPAGSLALLLSCPFLPLFPKNHPTKGAHHAKRHRQTGGPSRPPPCPPQSRRIHRLGNRTPLGGRRQRRQRHHPRPHPPGTPDRGRQGRSLRRRRTPPGVPRHRRLRRPRHESRRHALLPAEPGPHRRLRGNHGPGPRPGRPGPRHQLRQNRSGHGHGRRPARPPRPHPERGPHARRTPPGTPRGPLLRL